MSQNNPIDSVQIFIVDDDEQQAHLMQEMAKAADIKTHVFTSSIKFLQSKITPFDIVILDLQMPDKDGIEIMRELASNNIEPHFILVSGFDDRVLHSAKQLAESKHLNVLATLTKPFKTKDFIHLLKETYQACSLKQIENNSPSKTTLLETNLSTQSSTITVDELKLALRKHQLITHFQPQISFKTGAIQGAEVLIHWQHPTKGLMSPEQLLPLAEEHQLMNLLTEEILMLTIKGVKKMAEHNLDIKISVNLSGQNISDLSMPEKLEALFKSNHISPESFSLEITEPALMNDLSETLDILNRLRMKGFSLSIDNFGTGHSSLIALYQAPFTELKIDQTFIKDISSDNDAAAIVKICILLANELKMHCVAEGVETEESWNQLKVLGCETAQGSYISPPLAIDAFITWLKNQSLTDKVESHLSQP